MNDLTTLEQLEGETPNAYRAFCDYVAMGSKRSLPKLAARYQADAEASPTRRLATLKEWSSKYEWQRRINEYQREITLQAQQTRHEVYQEYLVQAVPMVDGLLGNIQRMLDDFQRLRTTRRQMIPDPRDAALPANEQRMIESIQTKVNTRDLKELIGMYGQLGRDLRTMLGLPQVMEIEGGPEVVLKTYVGVNPDDWDNTETPAIPDRIPEPEEDVQEDFPE